MSQSDSTDRLVPTRIHWFVATSTCTEALPESEGQSLDVHISNLRRKIGPGLIRTVRGIGYVIDTDDRGGARP